MRNAFDVVALLFKRYNNSEELLIIGFVVLLGRNYFPRLEGH